MSFIGFYRTAEKTQQEIIVSCAPKAITANRTSRADADLVLVHQLIAILPIRANSYVMDLRAVRALGDIAATAVKNATTVTTAIRLKGFRANRVCVTSMVVSVTNATS